MSMMPVFPSIHIPKTMMRVIETRVPGMPPVVALRTLPIRSLLQTACLSTCLISFAVCAQTPSAPNLPDGSRDSYLALGWANESNCQLGGDQRNRLKAYWQFQWSNGAFIRNTTFGWHLSEQAHLEYGPLLEYLPSCDWSVIGRGRQTTRSASNVAVGGFFNYKLNTSWRFSSKFSVVADGEKSKRLNLDVRRFFKPDLHQAVSLGVGYTYYQRAFLQDGSRFDPEFLTGVGGNSDGGYTGIKEYKFSKNGVDDNRQLYLNLNWNWELNPSWMMTSSVSVARNLGDAGVGVQAGQRYTHSVFSGFAYRF